MFMALDKVLHCLSRAYKGGSTDGLKFPSRETTTQSGVSVEIKGETLLVIHPDHIKAVRYSRIFAH